MQITLPTLIIGLVTGSIGLVGFVYGKKMSEWKPMAVGVALMIYPYLVPGLWPQIGVGIALTAALFLWRD